MQHEDPNPALVGGIVLSCLGCAALSVGGWGLLQVVGDSDWVSTQAEVLRFDSVPYTYEGVRKGGGTYVATGTRVRVWYRYEVGGETYESSRYSVLEPWDDHTDDAKAKARLAELEANGRVQVWYDPAAPASAVLARAERAPPTVVALVGTLLLAIGISRLVAWRRRLAAAADPPS